MRFYQTGIVLVLEDLPLHAAFLRFPFVHEIQHQRHSWTHETVKSGENANGVIFSCHCYFNRKKLFLVFFMASFNEWEGIKYYFCPLYCISSLTQKEGTCPWEVSGYFYVRILLQDAKQFLESMWCLLINVK